MGSRTAPQPAGSPAHGANGAVSAMEGTGTGAEELEPEGTPALHPSCEDTTRFAPHKGVGKLEPCEFPGLVYFISI